MQFSLANKERIGWLMIGTYLFTYDEPGPKEIDINKVSEVEKSQLLYNVRRGALSCNDCDNLLKACSSTWAASKGFVTPEEKPIDAKKPIETIQADSVLEGENKELRALLRSPMPSIKQKAKSLSFNQVKKLVKFEKETKNRKNLLVFLDVIVKKFEAQVTSKISGPDIANMMKNISKIGSNDPNLSVITEEEEVLQMVLNPLEDQTSQIK